MNITLWEICAGNASGVLLVKRQPTLIMVQSKLCVTFYTRAIQNPFILFLIETGFIVPDSLCIYCTVQYILSCVCLLLHSLFCS